MKKVFVLLVFAGLSFSLSPSLPAQEQAVGAGKMFYAELGGPGVLMSINWDMRFKSNTRLGFGYRVGVGFSIGEFEEEKATDPYGYYESRTRSYYTIPIGLNYVLGKPNSSSAFEIGAGATFLTREKSLFTYREEKPGHFIGHLAFMYRITPVNGGFSFRVGFTPIIGTSGDLFPMGGISFGYVF
ncbi:MAG: hypothetical protein FWG84_00395 [Bacteroidales bacterium]|nr:hypothetical protein [Bacteroidales bacterium]